MGAEPTSAGAFFGITTTTAPYSLTPRCLAAPAMYDAGSSQRAAWRRCEAPLPRHVRAAARRAGPPAPAANQPTQRNASPPASCCMLPAAASAPPERRGRADRGERRRLPLFSLESAPAPPCCAGAAPPRFFFFAPAAVASGGAASAAPPARRACARVLVVSTTARVPATNLTAPLLCCCCGSTPGRQPTSSQIAQCVADGLQNELSVGVRQAHRRLDPASRRRDTSGAWPDRTTGRRSQRSSSSAVMGKTRRSGFRYKNI